MSMVMGMTDLIIGAYGYHGTVESKGRSYVVFGGLGSGQQWRYCNLSQSEWSQRI